MKNSAQAFLFAVLFSLFIVPKIYAGNPNPEQGDYYFDGRDQSMNYEYEVKTNIPPDKFAEHFYDKLSNQYHWEKACSSREENAYSSLWQFTDKHDKKWKCRVSIKSDADKENNENIMSVSMKITPFVV